ncbi:MAG: S-methyl-5'-thioadenosine phosphorylase [Candidatus Gastranaerophilales bacterium]|nr:S-methyl-5'-thioadenosine phosphorylase [Candidatus Gastranaerophilales bacterium]
MINNNKNKADIGVFGGSGFYNFLEDVQEIKIETPYGAPSDDITLGKIGDKKVAFLPRHGKKHSILPHLVNYRANVWAMKSLGVSRIFSPCAAGSLQKHIKPGDFVICDQFVNKTWGRPDTFYEGPIATHVSPADPYCPELRNLAIATAKELDIKAHETGTILAIQGPRFSTKAESKFYTAMGWEVINMTQYPEAYLARELEMCVVNISLITDYDAGLVGDVPPVSHSEVIKVFLDNNEKLRKLLFSTIEKIPAERTHCDCGNVLEHSRL